jgi:hypothetical protein
VRFRRSNNVEVVLVGGLGNQLFGLATAVSLAKKFDVEVTLNTSQLQSRPLSIPKQILRGMVCTDKPPLYYRFKSKSLRKIYRNLMLTNSYFEREFGFEGRFNLIRKPIRLHGYFQSFRYFEDHQGEIVNLLNDPNNLTDEYNGVRALLPNRFISIHFRRGDYLENSDFHPLSTKEYYLSAIQYLEVVGLYLEKVVFTDDELLAKEVFPKYTILTEAQLASPFDNLHMMSEGQAIIGANSTFSLWASFLLNARGGICIFPEVWFGKGFMEKLSPVPPNYIRL